MKLNICSIALLLTGVIFYSYSIENIAGFTNSNLNFACEQIKRLGEESLKANRIPRTLTPDGEMHWTKEQFDWTEGFFPGICWYLFDYSNDSDWKKLARTSQNRFKEQQYITYNHDMGFIFNNSFGHDYRLTNSEEAKQVLIQAGNSLSTRFNPNVGCIQSWEVTSGWQAKRGWQFPVIIDNMMNLEMLFELTEITGDDKYRNIAITHANTTLKNHFRADGSSYHVINYDSLSGKILSRETAQGFAHESSWARGQAWGLYGFTMAYRYTKDDKYLQKAEEIAAFIFTHKNLPSDSIPFWDYDADKIPEEPRDASAAAIIASALIELNTYTAKDYLTSAKTLLKNLSGEAYRAKLGENGNFILKHSVGSIPHNSEIDVPLIYADYYYIEALLRLRKIENNP